MHNTPPPQMKDKIQAVASEILNPHPNTQTIQIVMIIALMLLTTIAGFTAGFTIADSHSKEKDREMVHLLKAMQSLRPQEDIKKPFNYLDAYLQHGDDQQIWQAELDEHIAR